MEKQRIEEQARKENDFELGTKVSPDKIFISGYIQGAEWAIQETQPKWISIDFETPKEAGYYLTFRVNGILESQVVALWVNSGIHPSETGWSNVTHWMTLPNPPQEQ